MEMITIPGYLDDEKLQIAKQYLLPRSFENNGLKLGQIEYTEAALLKVATEYEKEPGVRMLQQNLDKVHRTIVYQLVRENGKSAAGGTEPEKFLLDAPDIERYLGKPRHSEKGLNVQKPDRPGVAIGLCVTGGTLGATLMIETIAIPGEEGVNITGHMAELMKESAEVALAFAKKLAIEQYGVAPDFFKKNHIHIHVPTANPKDGNSAGITIAAALLSLFINKTITGTLVMTGEITLTGKVLAIGGLKEKLLGAKRNKAEHIIFPKENLPDWEEIPPEIREGITPHPVERFEEVLWDRYLSTVKIADPSAIDELAE
jgi:ATP-dependent Lon protease